MDFKNYKFRDQEPKIVQNTPPVYATPLAFRIVNVKGFLFGRKISNKF